MGMENDPNVTEAIVWEGPVSSSMIVVGSTVYFGGNPMIPVKQESVGPLISLHHPVTHSLCMVGF